MFTAYVAYHHQAAIHPNLIQDEALARYLQPQLVAFWLVCSERKKSLHASSGLDI